MFRIVIIITSTVEQSGLEIFAGRLNREFVRRGIKTYLIVQHTKVFDDGKMHFHSLSEVESWLIKRKQEYDVLFWAGFPPDIQDVRSQLQLSSFIRKEFGKRVFFIWERTGHKIVLHQGRENKSRISNGGDGYFVLNEEQMKELELHTVPHNQIHLISPGVDTSSEFTPVKSTLELYHLRRILGWPSDKIIILSTSRFTKRKRIEWLTNAWLKDTYFHDKTHLVLVGSGFSQKDSIEDDLKKLSNLSSGITIIPHEYNISRAPFYRAADIFVAAGVIEGEPSVLSEAMACGLPVIASNIPGHRKLVLHNKTGVLFDTDNSTELISALHRLIDNPDQIKALGLAAREIAVNKRDISIVADNILDILEKELTRAK